MPSIYSWDNPEDFERNIRSILVTEKRRGGGGSDFLAGGDILYAEVTEVVSDSEVKAVQKVWNSQLNMTDPKGGYDDPEGTAWTWDTDEFNMSEPAPYTLRNIQTDAPLEVGDVIEVIYYPDKSLTSNYKARIGGSGGASLVYVEITSNTNRTTYTGDSYDDPVNLNLIDSGITIRAMNITAGDPLPNSAAGEGWWATKVGDNYFIEPPVAIGEV